MKSENIYVYFKSPSLWCAVIVCGIGFLAAPFSHAKSKIVVNTTAELVAAMVPQNAGRNILIKAGTYCPNVPLTVPVRARVVGEGRMHFDNEGLPTGFEANSETRIMPADGGVLCPAEDGTFAGNTILHLSDGSSLRRIQVSNVPAFPVFQGNAVRIQAKGKEITRVSLIECDIQGAGDPIGGPMGPIGRAVYIHTGIGPGLTGIAGDPPGDPSVAVRIEQSVLRGNMNANGGTALFLINFESKGAIFLSLRKNVVKESNVPLDAAGGSSFTTNSVDGSPPVFNEVENASLFILSLENLYQGLAGTELSSTRSRGWLITGGLNGLPPGSPGSNFNRVWMTSLFDRVEDVTIGISANAALRRSANHQPVNGNGVDLQLMGTTFASFPTPTHPARDLEIYSTLALAPVDFVGNENSVSVLGLRMLGSGPTSNLYSVACAPDLQEQTPPSCAAQTSPHLGNNAIGFLGKLKHWLRSNEDIDPPPPEEFFNR